MFNSGVLGCEASKKKNSCSLQQIGLQVFVHVEPQNRFCEKLGKLVSKKCATVDPVRRMILEEG